MIYFDDACPWFFSCHARKMSSHVSYRKTRITYFFHPFQNFIYKELTMSKKILIIIALIIFPLVVGLACRFTSSPDPTPTPTEELVIEIESPTEAPTLVIVQEEEQEEEQVEPTPEPVEVATDLVILEESAWMQEGSLVFVGYLIENPSSDLLYENVEFTIRLFGFSGNLIDTGYSSVPWFFPNMTTGVVSTFYVDDDSVIVDSVEVNWTFKGTSSPDTFENPFTTENIVLWDNAGYPVVTGRIINNSSTTYTDVSANIICYDSDGEVIGGGISYLTFIHQNDFMGFITYVDTFGDVASVEVFPSLNYYTQFIDKTDFWSEISILDDYFFEDEFGFIKGGIVLQNETDSVLRYSYIYVTFFDEDDNITTTGEEYIALLLPGDSLGIIPWISTPPEGSTSVRYDLLLLPGETVDDFELDSNPFRVNRATVTGDFDDYVLVNFTNTYTKQVSDLDVYVMVYNADGQIIGGGTNWTRDSIPAGGTAEIEVWVTYSDAETIATIDAWVIPNLWTTFD